MKRSFIIIRRGVAQHQFEADGPVDLLFNLMDGVAALGSLRSGPFFAELLVYCPKKIGSRTLENLEVSSMTSLGDYLEESKEGIWQMAVYHAETVERETDR